MQAMSNPYGISLDREWTEWVAKAGVSPTVAAALFLISERHPSHEVMAKLTPSEVEQVAKIVRRWPDCFPPGSVDALKSRGQTLAQPPSVRVSADPTSRRRPARVSAESLHRRAYTRRFEHAQGAGMPGGRRFNTRSPHDSPIQRHCITRWVDRPHESQSCPQKLCSPDQV